MKDNSYRSIMGSVLLTVSQLPTGHDIMSSLTWTESNFHNGNLK